VAAYTNHKRRWLIISDRYLTVFTESRGRKNCHMIYIYIYIYIHTFTFVILSYVLTEVYQTDNWQPIKWGTYNYIYYIYIKFLNSIDIGHDSSSNQSTSEIFKFFYFFICIYNKFGKLLHLFGKIWVVYSYNLYDLRERSTKKICDSHVVTNKTFFLYHAVLSESLVY